MKIFAPVSRESVGGGWTFYRNFKKGMSQLPDVQVEFVDTWQECDIFFITGVTIVDPSVVREASKAGKKIVLRVDNVPRKSRNRRSTPHERLKEFAELADAVIYQSEWAKNYCKPLCGIGDVIYNGVDTDIFYPPKNPSPDRENNFLFLFHGKNEHKGFAKAHYLFQMEARKNPKAKFYFVYDFGRDLPEMIDANFDFWNGENYEYIPKIENPDDVADLMRSCKTLIFPSICDASPNTVLEARACGMDVMGEDDKSLSGTAELMKLEDISLVNMCEQYYGLFSFLQ